MVSFKHPAFECQVSATLHICVCVCVCVCACVCVCVRMYVRAYVCMHAWTYVQYTSTKKETRIQTLRYALTKNTPCIDLFRYIMRCSKLPPLTTQIQYHVNVIYSLGDRHVKLIHLVLKNARCLLQAFQQIVNFVSNHKSFPLE